jgi:hypothetical protein
MYAPMNVFLLVVFYTANKQVAPSYENIELGIGEQVIMKVIAEATGRLMKNVSTLSCIWHIVREHILHAYKFCTSVLL